MPFSHKILEATYINFITLLQKLGKHFQCGIHTASKSFPCTEIATEVTMQNHLMFCTYMSFMTSRKLKETSLE